MGAGAVAAIGTGGLAMYFARRVITPVQSKPDDVAVLDVSNHTVTLTATPDSLVAGRYGLWLDHGSGHARVGDIVRAESGRVVRAVEQVDYGVLKTGAARWNQYYYAGPPSSSLGIPHDDVSFSSEVGPLPAWFVPADEGTGTDTWAICVHGHGATREEALRVIPLLHALGLPVMVPGYRNDHDGSPGPRGRYHLGSAEWVDIESAVVWACQHGARQVVLFGWSMGGTIVMEFAARSWLAERVAAIVLDAPALDWRNVLAHQARAHHLPYGAARFGEWLMRRRSLLPLTGLDAPVDVRELRWPVRSAGLRHPTLLIHSDADQVVPPEPSRELASARPDLVQFERWPTARHTKEWNVDPVRWERVVRTFLTAHVPSVSAGRRPA